jgi:hypothetical protein
LFVVVVVSMGLTADKVQWLATVVEL